MKNYAVVMYDKNSGLVLTRRVRDSAVLHAVRQAISEVDTDPENLVIVDILDRSMDSMLERISTANEWK